jgi:ABC-type antimicrobial peptide transport system permease subunit
VRLALGATRGQVIVLTVRQAALVTVIGLTVGSALAFVLGRVMSTTLFGLVSLRFWPMALMIVAIGVTALAAGYLPARRAANLDPTEALRTN